MPKGSNEPDSLEARQGTGRILRTTPGLATSIAGLNAVALGGHRNDPHFVPQLLTLPVYRSLLACSGEEGQLPPVKIACVGRFLAEEVRLPGSEELPGHKGKTDASLNVRSWYLSMCGKMYTIVFCLGCV